VQARIAPVQRRDGKTLATAISDAGIKLGDPATNKEMPDTPARAHGVDCGAPDNRSAATRWGALPCASPLSFTPLSQRRHFMSKLLTLATLVAGLVLVPAAGVCRGQEVQGQGYIGVQISDDENGEGVVINEVIADTMAAKAGLKAGDVILKVDDVETKDVQTLVRTISPHKPGDKITVKIKREGKEQSFQVTVGKRPDN
jgi:hypothetical protein